MLASDRFVRGSGQTAHALEGVEGSGRLLNEAADAPAMRVEPVASHCTVTSKVFMSSMERRDKKKAAKGETHGS